MKMVYDSSALSMLPTNNGFIIVTKQNTYEDKIIVAYKHISFENSTLSPVTKSVYQLAKFGGNYKSYEMQVNNYITCRVVFMEHGRLFVVCDDGTAKILDSDANTIWQGTMMYKDHGPFDIAIHGHTLWASFPESNALIRFNLVTMREELRIGGVHDPSFSSPEGLWINEGSNSMLVCNSKTQNILEVDLKSFTVFEYAKFEEPVHSYIKVNSNELVLLDSGIYKL